MSSWCFNFLPVKCIYESPLAWAAVRSKAVVLLLLICWLVCSLVVGVLCSSFFCCALLYVLSSFAIILKTKRDGCVGYIVLRLSCYCQYSVTLPRDAFGWSAVCNCGIS